MEPARLMGRAPEQVRAFLARVEPRLERARDMPAFDDPLEV